MGKPLLEPDQFDRYRRHLSLPELGVDGQKALLGSSALLIGAGGLGCPLAQYLAAAGVGRLGLVDFDSVEIIGRPGWERVLQGYRRTAVLLRKELDCHGLH